ncbi:DUF1302 domain-containing protein [Pseudomonas mangrovi]|uniref:DUF1302 domain-containing protein n=1 Tax=Pseudomonas mangrovi TaxID=2161748 RepID=A0A2T5PA78_9PSED|nr:DUF1302 domain-containing protein [Pseudomonas mangrovi]PTU74648.1 DUF1302 domain-containing protein [Pseudomonas mangrovi]
MTPAKPFWRLAKLPLAIGLASTLAAPAYAVSFNIGDIEGQFDSSMSLGASWAMDKADKDLVGTPNGGIGFTTTGDDGRLNFKRGETFSKIFKGVHDLELRYGDTGVFVRGKYWYDFELKDESRLFKDISDSNRKEGAQSSGAQILDAFIYHNYSLGDQPGSVRAGRQVVSWGESTFIMNSINSINPIDAAAARRPGAEVKEALLPVNMLYVSQSLTDQLAMEAFYQLEWDQTIAENCGTFFSVDVAADGCVDYPALSKAQIDGLKAFGFPAVAAANGIRFTDEGVMIRRGQDRDARDSGQWGLALRWLGEQTEYGAFIMNYHSRAPIVGYQNGSAADIQNAFATAGGAFAQPMLLGTGNYYLEYPEDIRLYGLSFSTTLPTGTAWQGEVSYRPNMPIALNTTINTGRIATDPVGAFAGAGGGLAGVAAAAGRAGIDHRGYNRKEMTQVQTTFTHFFDQVMGADRLTVVGEIGATRLGGLEARTYGRDAFSGNPFSDPLAAARYGTGGYFTSSSWGYRTRAVWDYSDVFAGVNLSPVISWSHDVDGYGPTFNEGSKAVSIGVDANYRNTYSASLSYTDFFGGDYNVMTDRDFLALSVGMNF